MTLGDGSGQTGRRPAERVHDRRGADWVAVTYDKRVSRRERLDKLVETETFSANCDTTLGHELHCEVADFLGRRDRGRTDGVFDFGTDAAVNAIRVRHPACRRIFRGVALLAPTGKRGAALAVLRGSRDCAVVLRDGLPTAVAD